MNFSIIGRRSEANDMNAEGRGGAFDGNEADEDGAKGGEKGRTA